MDKLNVNQKSLKQAKAKKKPLKVVYISNPVKLTTTAARFRAVVQELTGQDSNIAETTMVDQFMGSSDADTTNSEEEPRRDLPGKQKVGADQTVQLADEVFTSPLLENFSALCESQHIGNGFWEY